MSTKASYPHPKSSLQYNKNRNWIDSRVDSVKYFKMYMEK